MLKIRTTRRFLFSSVPAAFAAMALGGRAIAGDGDAFHFEVTRTDEEWRAMLTETEYTIMRLGGTEAPKSDPLWDSEEDGTYTCKGCDLPLYEGRFKVVIDKGWLFYRHSYPNSVLTGIDKSVYSQFAQRDGDKDAPMLPTEVDISQFSDEERDLLDPLLSLEVHCRRCASHLGHILYVENKLVHCINGTSLNFSPEAA